MNSAPYFSGVIAHASKHGWVAASGLVAGALLVSEAGGTVTDLAGEPWTTGSRDFLAAAPGIHAAALKVLSPIA